MAKTPEVEAEPSNKISKFISGNEFFLLAIIIIFLGALWRIWGLTVFKGFSQEEIVTLNLAKTLYVNHWIPQAIHTPGIVLNYIIAGLGAVSAYNVVIFRLMFAIIGVLASVFFFLFVKSWFNKQIALIATLLFATNTTMLILSSVVNPIMLVIALQMIVLYLVTLAFRDKKIWLFLLASLFVVVGMLVSPYFVFSGILLFLVSLVIATKNPKIFNVYKWELIVTIVVLLVAISGYSYLVRNIAMEILSFLNPGSFARFYFNLGDNLLSLFSGSQFVNNLNVASEPILDPFVAVSAVCGIIYAFFHGGKRKHQFVLLWLLLGLIVVSLSGSQGILGLALILPVTFIISAIMLDYLLTSWVRTFPYNKSARLVMTLVFSLFLFLSVYYNFEKYFYGWQSNPKINSQYSLNIEK